VKPEKAEFAIPIVPSARIKLVFAGIAPL
jgi:hypothetical protein